MTEVMEFMLTCLSDLLSALMSAGGVIGAFIVCSGIFIRLVRLLRSIIQKN